MLKTIYLFALTLQLLASSSPIEDVNPQPNKPSNDKAASSSSRTETVKEVSNAPLNATSNKEQKVDDHPKQETAVANGANKMISQTIDVNVSVEEKMKDNATSKGDEKQSPTKRKLQLNRSYERESITTRFVQQGTRGSAGPCK